MADDERVADEVQDLFRLHYLGLVRLTMRLVDDQETAEDLVQDVFVTLSRRRKLNLDDPSRYLRTAVVNQARSVLRRRKVARAFWSRRPRQELGEPADQATVRHSDRQQMLHAISRLPQRQREVLVLRYYEDRTVAEIAEILGISPGAVSSAINRGLGALSSITKDQS